MEMLYLMGIIGGILALQVVVYLVLTFLLLPIIFGGHSAARVEAFPYLQREDDAKDAVDDIFPEPAQVDWTTRPRNNHQLRIITYGPTTPQVTITMPQPVPEPCVNAGVPLLARR